MNTILNVFLGTVGLFMTIFAGVVIIFPILELVVARDWESLAWLAGGILVFAWVISLVIA